MPNPINRNDIILVPDAIDLSKLGVEVTDSLRDKLTQFCKEVQEGSMEPSQSRNYVGWELVKRLHTDPSSLTKDERSQLLFISCDNNTDQIGTALNIEVISLSPRTLEDVDLGRDILRNSMGNRHQSVFKFSSELLDTLRTKLAVIFVTDYNNRIGAIGTFYGFLDNDFCHFLISNKHVFFAIGAWREGAPFRYNDSDTICYSRDAADGGQDVWTV